MMDCISRKREADLDWAELGQLGWVKLPGLFFHRLAFINRPCLGSRAMKRVNAMCVASKRRG